MIWLLLGLGTVGVIYYYLIKPHKYWTERGVKQRKPVFIAGDNWGTFMEKQSFADMIYDVYNAYPNTRYSGMYQFLTPILILKDLELIKKITVKDFDYFFDHPNIIPSDADPFWSCNLFALKGQRWKNTRQTISPAFTINKMKEMYELISETAEHFVNHFLNKNEDIITVQCKDIFSRYATDIIATIAFGIKCDSLEEPNNEFYVMGKNLVSLITIAFLPKFIPLFRNGLLSESEKNFFLNLVKDTIKVREQQNIVRPDLINVLIESRKNNLKYEENNDNNNDAGFATVEETDTEKSQKLQKRDISDIDITGQALIFFFAGYDAVSDLMCFMTYELAVNPEIQQRLQNEIDETFQSCNGKLTYEALIKMKYLDMVVSESLRKWPIAVITDRVCTKSYTIPPTSSEEKPVYLKEGDVVWIPTYALHRDPQYFANPDKFDPERFSDENKDKIVPYSYMPFGVGPRKCIGPRFSLLETKTLIFYLLSNFQIVPIEQTQIPIKIGSKKFNLTPAPDCWLGLKHRKL